jgi:hypothetical protein
MMLNITRMDRVQKQVIRKQCGNCNMMFLKSKWVRIFMNGNRTTKNFERVIIHTMLMDLVCQTKGNIEH